MKKRQTTIIASVVVVCCLFVFTGNSVFAATYPEGSTSYKNAIVYLYPSNATSTDTADLYMSWLITSFYPYTNASTGDDLVCYECKLVVRNTTGNDLIIPSTYLRITPNFNFSSAGSDMMITEVEYVSGQLLCDRVGTNGSFYFSNAPDNALFSYIVVPAHGDISCVFNIRAKQEGTSVLGTFTIAVNTPTLPFTPVVVATGDSVFTSYDSYIPWIYYRLNTIYDAIISQAQSGQETVDTGEDTQTQIDDIHDEEQTWFTGTETAIEGTGLGTFSFTGDAGTGITGVKDQFTDLWNHMGALTIVPIFALSLKLASTIIRHRPEKRRTGSDMPSSRGRVLQGGFAETTYKNGDRSGVIW